MDLAVEKDASAWVTALPLDEYGFALHKSAFKMLLPCVMAGFCFALLHTVLVEHLFLLNTPYPALKVGYLLFDTRDLAATLLTEAFSQVTTEPELPLVSQEDFSLSTANLQDGARLDIAMNRFWGGRSECVFVDVCIFS